MLLSSALLIICLAKESIGFGFGKCGTDDTCNLAGSFFQVGHENVIKSIMGISSADECSCRCKLSASCRNWNYLTSSSWCTLLSGATETILGDGFAGARGCSDCKTDAGRCTEKGIRYVGTPLKTVSLPTSVDCSCSCFQEKGCISWSFKTLKGDTEDMFKCTLLGEGTAREEDINYESAIINCDSSPLPPQPEKPEEPEEPEKVKEFKFVNEQKSWAEAKIACENFGEGSHLVSFQSMEELKKASALAGGQRFWTGGYRLAGGESPWTGMWRWIGDNSKFTYIDFSQGQQPSGSWQGKDELHVEVYNLKINDRNGNDKLPFVCQISMKAIVVNPCANGACTTRTVWGPNNPHIIKGIWAIWWDPKFDHLDIAEQLADKLETVRKDTLANLDMTDPPNMAKGNYYNVYIHHNSDDDYPNGWAQGQGTDKFGNPFLTFPHWLVPNSMSIYHEGYHVFQYTQNSPGFVYSGDSQWYTESSAQWYMSTYVPTKTDTYGQAGAIVANPQLTLWHSFNNKAPQDPNHDEGKQGWMYGVRQYGMHTFLNYLTEVCGVARVHLNSGWSAATNLSPQQYLFEKAGNDIMRNCFANWAAENTADMQYLTRAQYERSLMDITHYGTWDLYRPYVWEAVDTGTQGAWVGPPEELRPRGWAYNAMRVNNTMAATYTFEFNGSQMGSEGAQAFFVTRIVVQSKERSPIYKDLPLENGLAGSGTVQVAPDDFEVAIVVASVPEMFGGYQNYPYKVKITRS